jgi:hypothetical protein
MVLFMFSITVAQSSISNLEQSLKVLKSESDQKDSSLENIRSQIKDLQYRFDYLSIHNPDDYDFFHGNLGNKIDSLKTLEGYIPSKYLPYNYGIQKAGKNLRNALIVQTVGICLGIIGPLIITNSKSIDNIKAGAWITAGGGALNLIGFCMMFPVANELENTKGLGK